MLDYTFLPAAELARRIRAGDVSPVEVVDDHLHRIRERNDRVNAYVTVTGDSARERAKEAERAVDSGAELGPLHGVPVAIKDLVRTAGVRTTFGSPAFAEFIPNEDAVLVERLREAGAIVLGKTNTPEFGHKGTTDNRLFGPTGTPYDPERTAGGSSGGSAAAVADGMAALAQGSDGGGSIRIPASACNVVGMMPSFGRVPVDDRPDAIHHTPFSQNGPLARTTEDAALMLDVLAGPHPRDPMCLPDEGIDYVAAAARGVDGLSIAFSPDLGIFPVEERIRSTVEDAADALSAAGADVDRADPAFERSRESLLSAWKTGFQVALAASNAGLRREAGIDLVGTDREGTTPELVDHIEAGEDASAMGFKRADAVRTAVFDAVQDLFETYDLLVTPTLALPPFSTDLLGPTAVDGEEIDPLYGWFLTWPFNMSGHPAASVPAGFTDDLPVGLQVVGPRHRDDLVLAGCGAIEAERPWHDAYPPA